MSRTRTDDKAAPDAQIPGVSWPRFSAYRVVAAGSFGLGVVVPVQGAELGSYDPWRHVGADPRGLVRALMPQAELSRWALAVERRIDAPGGTWALTKRERADLVAWANRWGLPGLLLPRIAEWPRDGRVALYGDRGHVETRELWDPRFLAYFPSLRGKPARALAELETLRPEHVDFWHLYGEPVLPLVRAVADWSRALCALADLPADNVDHALAADELNRHSEQTHLILGERSDGAYVPAWQSQSLLGHYSTMVLAQYANGPAKVCARCGAPFFPKGYQSRYCTTACKLAANKATQRRRQAKEEP